MPKESGAAHKVDGDYSFVLFILKPEPRGPKSEQTRVGEQSPGARAWSYAINIDINMSVWTNSLPKTLDDDKVDIHKHKTSKTQKSEILLESLMNE